jgi:beta-fructofuranosidase
MWAWIFDGPGFATRGDFGWSGTMSLPRVISLGDDGALRMDVPTEIERLRQQAQTRTNLAVPADSELVLEGIEGNSIELLMDISAPDAEQYGVKVCCAPDGAEQTWVYFDAAERKLKVDTNRSSLTHGPKSIEAGPLELAVDEPLKLRVFVDKSVVEVLANERQAVMRRIYPSREDSVGVTLFARGGPARVGTLSAWQIAPSNPF